MGSLDEKPPSLTAKHSISNGDVETNRLHSPEVTLGTTAEVHDLTVLGYKPELQRNRSMFTLLFQSLAIAAVCYPMFPDALWCFPCGGGESN